MIDCQIFIEPYKSLRQHSIRTFFTGFGILWAMSLLVFFQGVGNGFRRGTVKNFSNFSRDVLEISINPTATKPLRLTKELCTSLMQGLSFFEGVLPTLE
ncbi:MAG: hypothetical protein NQ127_02415, partial [Candidatus Cardinium sp.]|nr:hypothetical protein [Candidatus Cardinium sp.]